MKEFKSQEKSITHRPQTPAFGSVFFVISVVSPFLQP